MADLKRGICAVISAGRISDIQWLKKGCEDCDTVICADGGYRYARAAEIKADAVVGDFDSGEAPQDENVTVFPVRKDDTDTALAIESGISLGYRRFKVFGAVSGARLDHTAASITLCAKYALQGISITLFDEKNEITVLVPGVYELENSGKKLSLFAFGESVEGLCEKGVGYSLENYTLSPFDPLCVSNEIVCEKAVISFKSGVLLVIRSTD